MKIGILASGGGTNKMTRTLGVPAARMSRSALAKSGAIHVPLAVRSSEFQTCGQARMAIFVSQKSAIKMVMEMTTTVRVVLSPTPAVPPRVVIPK